MMAECSAGDGYMAAKTWVTIVVATPSALYSKPAFAFLT